MILQPIDFIVYAWLLVAVLSAAYVAYDQFRNNPEAPVMKWGFVPRSAGATTRGETLEKLA